MRITCLPKSRRKSQSTIIVGIWNRYIFRKRERKERGVPDYSKKQFLEAYYSCYSLVSSEARTASMTYQHAYKGCVMDVYLAMA
jgi:hypothetical protein